MASICKNIKYLNSVEPTKDFCSAFEIADLISYEFEKILDEKPKTLFRGYDYLGFSLHNSLCYVESNFKRVNYNKLDESIIHTDCSDDGHYIAVITKANDFYLIYSPKKMIIFKQHLKINKLEKVNEIKIFKFDDLISEIWMFLNKSIVVFRNIYFSKMTEAIAKDDVNCVNNLQKDITIYTIILNYFQNGCKIINVAKIQCKIASNFLVAILYSNILVVMLVHFDQQISNITWFYETYLEDIDIDLTDNSVATIQFLSDEVNLLVLDGNNKLWICNYITGCISGKLSLHNKMCMSVVNSLSSTNSGDMIVMINNDDKDTAYIELISFPKLEEIERFSVSSNCFVLPFCKDTDSIIIIDCQTLDKSYHVTLKSISRLDPSVKLQEIIMSGNYEQARNFAKIYNLDQEIIYIHELNTLIDKWQQQNQSLTNQQQIMILNCVKEIKKYFDVEVLRKLVDITMNLYNHEYFLLSTLHEQSLQYRDNHTDGQLFHNIINQQLKQFHIFQLFISPLQYSAASWNQFRHTDYQSILLAAFTTISDISLIISVWKYIQNDMDDMFVTSTVQFCHHVKILGETMIVNRVRVEDYMKLFNWLTDEVVPKQVANCPEQLRYIIDVIELLIRQMEATHDKQYQYECSNILRVILINLGNISIQTGSTAMKARIIVARMDSSLKDVNHIRRLINLQNDLCQLDRLLKNYNLDLHLDVLENETGMSIAMRILDQTSNSELNGGIIWDKLNNFLIEFHVRQNEFYYHYICQKLIGRVSFKTDNVANDSSGEYSTIFNRFVILLDKIDDKQIQLDCLAAFASNADVPFKEPLTTLITTRMTTSHPNNPLINKLKLLLRKSRITPICNRYGKVYNAKGFNVRNLLFLILQNDCVSANAQCCEDIECIINEFELDDILLLQQRCNVYMDDVFFKDELISYNAYNKLTLLLCDCNLSINMRNDLLNYIFNRFRNLMTHINEWTTDSLSYICDIGISLANKYNDDDIKRHWLKCYNILKLCLQLQQVDSNVPISISVILRGDYLISDLQSMNFRIEFISNYLFDHLLTYFTNISSDQCDYLILKNNIFQLIKTRRTFCLHLFDISKTQFMKCLFSVLIRLINFIMETNQSLACLVIFCNLEIMQEFVENFMDISYFNDNIQMIMSTLINVDITSNVFIIHNILQSYSNILGVYINAGIKYHSMKFRNVQRVLIYANSLLRCFSYGETPELYPEMKVFKKNNFQEKPDSVDILDKLIPLLRSALIVISSKNGDFEKVLSDFRSQCLSALMIFLDNKLYIVGYLGGLGLLVQISDKLNILELSNYIRSNDKVFTKAWRLILKNRKIDIPFLSSLILLCNPHSSLREMEGLLRKCSKSSKTLMDLYQIAAIVLSKYNPIEVTNRNQIFDTMTKEVRRKNWNLKLKDYEIKLLSSEYKDLKDTSSKMFQHPNMTMALVQEFLKDFQMTSRSHYLRYFKNIFKDSFSDCTTFRAYKIRVEQLIARAENVWTKIPRCLGYSNKLIHSLTTIANFVSPYHYEILEYLYGKLFISDTNYLPELKILELLYKCHRTSTIGEQEANFCLSQIVKLPLSNPREAEYVSLIRLPFHLILSDDPMTIIGPELNDSNISLWYDIHSVKNKMSYINKNIFSKDILQETTVKNQMKQFLRDSNLSNNDVYKKHVFLGDLYQSSCSWFNKTVNNLIVVLQDVIENGVFISIIKEFSSYLVVGEQLMYIMTTTLKWIELKLSADMCNSKESLNVWREEIIKGLLNLKIEEILYKYNFYKEEYLEVIHEHHNLLVQILYHERINMNKMSSKRINDVVTILVDIAKITGIDIQEFSCNFARLHLKLINPDQESFSEMEQDLSILNASFENSIDETREIPQHVDINELEILSLDNSIKLAMKDSLFEFLNENAVTLVQWNNILLYFFRTFAPSEDNKVDKMCNCQWYTSFLLFLELNALNLQKYIIHDCEEEFFIERKIREFGQQDKTDIIKQLYNDSIGINDRRPILATANNLSILKDIINIYPETIDMDDEQVKNIHKKIFPTIGDENS